MSKTIVLELDDADYERLLQEAQIEGRNVEELAARRLRPVAASATSQPAQNAFTASPALNGPNSDWDQLLQSFARSQAAQQGGTPEAHLARLQASLHTQSDATSGLGTGEWPSDPAARHFGAINSGDVYSADNDRIDADLARYYLAELDDKGDAA